MKLSKTEEQLMQYLWKLEKAYLKDILEAYDDPKPASTTIATLLKRIRDKGYIDYKRSGKSREYYPLISKSEYFGKHFRGLLQNFFGNSASTFASFFTRATDLSTSELEELRQVIDEEIKKKQK
ncbi:BlaI/MecI/CopY family transcriptional regulator [Aureispira anguillae]|uniref:BlaI/MecI/CopY family transcriptional regulator n=1 Tax=Aureispira anguillae TaxID=2864201 RepID=A0A915YJ38_9BACT|nr:BlaI/MecI/CopY family transcriptional regulator [Aureispira anguillae]BDS13927.1 BlaI/MecI/CopY family transcriptional regulator [Aureispira anguillae]